MYYTRARPYIPVNNKSFASMDEKNNAVASNNLSKNPNKKQPYFRPKIGAKWPIFLINFVQFFNNQQNLQIIEVMQPNYLEGLSLSSTPACYYWLQVVEKNKRAELMIEDRLCVMQKFGDKSISASSWRKCWENASSSFGFCYHWHQVVEK